MTEIHHGMNRSALDKAFRALGGEILNVRGTGDVVYVHRLMSKRVRANGRRKDASRVLTEYVFEVVRRINETAANDDRY